MINRLANSGHRDQRGITGLETAIILIAFVVVASVFAYTILSAGIFSAEKGKEAVYSGLDSARSSMSISGPVLAKDNDGDGDVDEIVFVVSNSLGGEAIDLTITTDTGTLGILSDEANSLHTTVATYIDKNQRQDDTTWTILKIGREDGDSLLEAGEKFEITVDLQNLGTPVDEYDTFTIEFKPAKGSSLIIERTIPAVVTAVMDLR